ncbi:hypothetical protein Q8F55_000579 [Vanrija albida]|uniref:F-box domain-containing protein n=1 Tax=Vanrija albida TaxID=181172 RepID=A0ABR3QDN3_9TREE
MNAPRLPPEIWHMVINDHLDVNDDRATFLALLRVSSSLWYEAASVLYRNVDISGDKMSKLLLAGGATRHHSACRAFKKPVTRTMSSRRGECHPDCVPDSTLQYPDPSPRTRLAISLIQRLNLRDITIKHVSLMLAAAVPDVVLFPSVDKVHVYFTVDSTMIREKLSDRKHFPHTIKLFGAIHLCAWGKDFRKASKLTVNKYNTLSLHTEWIPVYGVAPSFITNPAWLDKSADKHWFIEMVDDLDPLPVFEPEYNAWDLVASPARFLVGMDHRSSPKIPIGDWDENETSQHQFRMNSSEHAPCIVCGGKMKLDERAFGCTFTTSW